MSTAYIWGYNIHLITTCGGLYVHNVHSFRVVLLALHTDAHDMKKERWSAYYLRMAGREPTTTHFGGNSTYFTVLPNLRSRGRHHREIKL